MQIGSGIGHAGPNTEQTKGVSRMALMKSALAAIAMHVGRHGLCAANPDAGGDRLEAAGNRPRHRRAQDRRALRAAAAEGAVSGRQGRARRQIRPGRPKPARCLHARDRFVGPPGADLHPWRRLCRRQQAQPRQPVLRQHHAVGGEERLCRRQRHLPAGAAIRLAGRPGRPRRRGAMGLRKDRRARRRSRAHLPDGTIRRRHPCRRATCRIPSFTR